jgi:hypothetical protein
MVKRMHFYVGESGASPPPFDILAYNNEMHQSNTVNHTGNNFAAGNFRESRVEDIFAT